MKSDNIKNDWLKLFILNSSFCECVNFLYKESIFDKIEYNSKLNNLSKKQIFPLYKVIKEKPSNVKCIKCTLHKDGSITAIYEGNYIIKYIK